MSELENQCLQLSAWILTNQIVDLNFEIRIKVVGPDVSFQVVLESFKSQVYSSRYGLQKVQRSKIRKGSTLQQKIHIFKHLLGGIRS